MHDVAEVLATVRDDVTVIGAIALEAALAGRDVRSAATTDVDDYGWRGRRRCWR